MTKNEAMDYLSRCVDGCDPDFDAAVELAVSALRAQSDAVKSAPLTLDELREMAEDPVYVVYADGSECWRIAGHFSIYAGMDVLCWRDASVSYRHDFETLRDYGKTWTAHLQKPKED